MAATRLVEKLDSHPVVQANYRKLMQQGEHFALLVWERVMRLSLHTHEPGIIQHGVDLNRFDTLPGHIADCIPCSREQAEVALGVLHDGLLLGVEEDELRLPVTLRPQRPMVAGTVASDRGGRPRRGESKQQARERRAAEQEREAAVLRAQGHMPLPITGGLAVDTFRNPTPKPQNLEVRFSGGVFDEVSALKTPEPGFEVSSRTVAAAACTLESVSSINSESSQQQQQRVPNPRAGETENLETEVSAVEVSAGVSAVEVPALETASRGLPGPSAGSPPPATSPPTPPATSDQAGAMRLAADAALALELPPNAVKQTVAIVQSFLARGIPLEVLRGLLLDPSRRPAARPGDPIRSLNWFSVAVDEHIEAARVRMTQGPVPQGVTPPANPRGYKPRLSANALNREAIRAMGREMVHDAGPVLDGEAEVQP